ERQVLRVAFDPVNVETGRRCLRARLLEELGREVEPRHVGAGARCRNAHVAGSAGDVEHLRGAVDRRALDDQPADLLDGRRQSFIVARGPDRPLPCLELVQLNRHLGPPSVAVAGRQSRERVGRYTGPRRQKRQKTKLASAHAATAAPRVIATGAPTTSAIPSASNNTRFTLSQARKSAKKKRARRMPRRTRRAPAWRPAGRSSHTGGSPSVAFASCPPERARSARSSLRDSSAVESRPSTKWRRSALAARSRLRSPTT